MALFIVRSSKISPGTKRMHGIPSKDIEAREQAYERLVTRVLFNEAFSGLKLEKGLSKGWTYFFFMRRVAFVFIFRCLHVTVPIKLALAVLLCFLQIMYIGIVRPFRIMRRNLLEIFNEGILAIILIILATSEKASETAGSWIIGLIWVLIIANMLCATIIFPYFKYK
jgi:hypothetical protein